MANTVISLKKSGTPSAIPVDLANGELAINYADGKIFYKSAAGSIQEISVSNSFGAVNANGTLIVADITSDVLSLVPGNGITIVGDAINDTITISSVADVSLLYDAANAAFDRANAAVQTGFVTVAANGTNLIADSNNDTLTLASSQNISIVGDTDTDSVSFDLTNTGVIASTYGGANSIPVLIVDEKGRITGISNVFIVISSPGGYFIGNRGDITPENFGDIFRVHSNTLTGNVTVYSGNNSIAAGPVTIGTGGKLTIQDGARVSII